MWSLELNTVVCPDGVEIVDNQHPSDRKLTLAQQTISAGDAGHGRRFVCKSKQRQPKTLTLDDLVEPVSVELLNATDDEQLCGFFARFGMIDSDCSPIAYDTVEMLRFQVDALLLRRNPDMVNKALARRVAVITPQLVGDPLTIRLYASDLVGFMTMEASAACELGCDVIACEQCGIKFMVGSHTGRRSSARFCSDYCRNKALRGRNRDDAQ